MILTNENYYSTEANWEYMSVSQYKQFQKCEAAAMAQLKGEWQQPKTTALLVGSYVDAWFEGTLEEFKQEHPELFKKDGTLKADFQQAEDIIARVQQDKVFMKYMSGRKQVIRTAELFGCKWKIKIDSRLRDSVVDLKVMRSMERIMGKSFVEHWGYDLQMAVYAAVEEKALRRKSPLSTYLAVVTKQEPADLDVIEIPLWRREELLHELERSMPHILDVKSGRVEPERCGICDYCRATKRIDKPIDFEMVGLSNAERKAIFGTL
jgi:hypothetical protein